MPDFNMKRWAALALVSVVAVTTVGGSLALTSQASLGDTGVAAGPELDRPMDIPAEAAIGTPPSPSVAASGPALSESEIELLARLIHAEAEGEPYVGKVAVGAVVLNRVESDRFPDSVREVIYARGQFSVVANGRINRAAGAESLAAARAAAAGEDPTGGALYFFAPAKTSDAFVWSRPHLVTIGNHRFTG